MFKWEGEVYCTATEAADILRVSRPTFYQNVRGFLNAHTLPARKRKHYRVVEVEQYKKVEVVA